MKKKTKIFLIGMLALGILLIPGSFLINNFIKDLTYSSVDEGLLGIKEQGPDVIEETTLNMGPSAMALTLRAARDKGMDYSFPLVYSSAFLGQVYIVESNLFGTPTVETGFYDQVEYNFIGSDYGTFSYTAGIMGFPLIEGIAEWFKSDLNFTRGAETGDYTGINNLKYGINITGWWGDRLPGFYEDTYRRLGPTDWPPDNGTDSCNNYFNISYDRGFGVIEMMELIESAIGDDIKMAQLNGEYGYNFINPDELFSYGDLNCTKLEILYYYYYDYFISEAIGLILEAFNEGLGGYNTLYDYIPQYFARDWCGDELSFEEFVYYSFIEQWAKGSSYDEGFDFHDVEPSIPAGTYGIEPAGPGNSSGIPMQAAFQLWNESNPLALTNLNGMLKWYEARTGNTSAAYQELLAEFSQYPGYNDYPGQELYYWHENKTYDDSDWGFDENDMDLLLDWLWGDGGGWGLGSFYEERLPTLLTDTLCIEILLESWADGTVLGEKLYPRGFPLPLGSVTVYGLEVGYQGPDEDVIPSNITYETALKLWDPENPYSLTNPSGLEKWFAAVEGDADSYFAVKNAHDLSIEQMYMLLKWIPNFQHNLMPYLAQYQYSLPADSITLGNILNVTLIGMGGLCVGLSALGISGKIKLKNRKKDWRFYKHGKKQ